MSVRSKRIERIAKANPFAAELAENTADVHQGMSLHLRGNASDDFRLNWYATPFMHTRDSNALDESNYEVIFRELRENFPNTATDHRFDHWGFGWYERVYVRADDAVAIDAVQRWVSALEDYPIANEEDYYRKEWDANHPSEKVCYAGDDCSCDYRTHSCVEKIWLVWDPSVGNDTPSGWEAVCDLCGEHFDPFDAKYADFWNEVRAYRAAVNDLEMEAAGQLRLF